VLAEFGLRCLHAVQAFGGRWAYSPSPWHPMQPPASQSMVGGEYLRFSSD
jgi:hypothetical protein